MSQALNTARVLDTALPKSGGDVSGPVVSTAPDNFRIVQGNYGVYWRFDSGNMFLMSTNSGDQRGGYSAMRPLAYNPSNGSLSLADSGHGVSVGSELTVKNQSNNYSYAIRMYGGGYAPILRSNGNASSLEVVNSANSQLNFSVFDGGDVRARNNVYAGASARLAPDGNVYGSLWGNDWLSNWLTTSLNNKMSARRGGTNRGYVVTDTDNNMILNWEGTRARMYVDGQNQGLFFTDNQLQFYGNVFTTDSMQQCGFIGGDTSRPYMMQLRGGATVNLMCERGAAVNRPTRANGYIEWLTDIGSVGTNYFTSDEFYKENITPNKKSYAQQVAAIKFVSFDFKQNELETDAGRHWDLGVIAQQVERDVSDEYVDYLSDGTLSLNTNKLLVLALKTIQELQARVDTLEAKAAP
jgi:hypothetical protein